ncbi:tRNA lysidine(34) synthetase TilS [Halomonas campisalis]|uniref:tRNA(Ile)-lysidine synthase n=1 Tax=Billgrantia campisalis TaxID=74661 RepID=A0ABS9PB40_9GAMM|nr:tRNA lysidine(34) synthetase TilS [Halomonas campisalis]MCG6658350.1 tRNA lysidine(34) synthetase TilS [Halomonas campisalis]MDR5863020.1 tRNA lysidine(34) synthetase TilS [Halomonas campisalis]
MSLQSSVDRALAQTPPGRCVWVAFSGGLDSTLLLTLAAEACRRHPRPLHALHVHHGLQAAAADFEAHCRRVASRLGVPLFVERVAVELAAGQGLEGAAREARYAAFARRVAPGETLWLAQHRNDQAETFLLAALRGSGVRGLAGMPLTRAWQARHLARPLLGVSRAELEAAAARQGLVWVDDPSNADEALDRNFLRRRVLPLLETRWPHAGEALASAATLCGDADTLLAELADQDLDRLGGEVGRLPADRLGELSLARQRLLVRRCCARLGLPLPPRARLETLLAQLAAPPDAQVRVAWPGAEARVWRRRLYLLSPPPPLPDEWDGGWSGRAPLATPAGQVAISLVPERERVDPPRLRVTRRRGGEQLRLPGRGRRDLKRLLQEAGVPPWERERLLVVWEGDTVVAALAPAGGTWLLVAEGWRASPASG